MTKRLRPIAQTKFRLAGGRWLKVKIWATDLDLTHYNNTAKRLVHAKGVFNGMYDWEHRQDADGKYKDSLHAIHLAKNRLGVGLWAHELQHFMADWCKINRWDATVEPWDERAARLAERLTRQFWSWYYREFPQVS